MRIPGQGPMPMNSPNATVEKEEEMTYEELKTERDFYKNQCKRLEKKIEELEEEQIDTEALNDFMKECGKVGRKTGKITLNALDEFIKYLSEDNAEEDEETQVD